MFFCYVGLNQALQIFMIFVQPLMRIWRSRGIMVFADIDNLFIVSLFRWECEEYLSEGSSFTTSSLINEKKCMPPCQLLDFLGIVVAFVKSGVYSSNHKQQL